MRSGQHRFSGAVWKHFLFAMAVLVSAAVIVLYILGVRTFADQTPADARASQRVAATAARIAAESREPAPPPWVRAPVLQPDSDTVAESEHTLTLPEGYSVVGFDGEMVKARVDNRSFAIDRAQAHDGLEWLGAPMAVETLAAQAAKNGRGWSFGWIRLAADARLADLEPSLTGAGASVVGSAGRLLRVRLPGGETRLAGIARLPGVNGVGAMPAEVRLRALDGRHVPDHEPTPVFVTLMEDDSDGHWGRQLAALGAVVGRYDPDIRVYEANVTRDVLDALGAADFVLAVEPVGAVEAAHDTAVPAMGADALRMYEGSPGLFSGMGGASTPIAVMDTGLNINHPDISSNRSSICGANFVYYDPLADDEDLWVDADGHGTHVTGTIVGNGAVQARYAGMAPLVRDIRFAKVLSDSGFGQDTFILRGMDFLTRPTACPEAGWSADPVKPLIVNMSLAASERVWEGRTVAERKLDAIVWGQRQLYVVANSNEGISGFSNYGAAKNSLAVGAALDSGSLAGFSSHGPTRDGRLAPQVVGVGVEIYSAAGDGSRGGYANYSGTSMSSPAVAGVAALLMDAAPAHRERPALARARLMASAIRPDAWLEDAAAFRADNSSGPGRLQMQYGLGKVSGRTSVLNRDRPDGWRSGSVVSELADGEYAHVDIDVPEGASRLDLVLTWDEPPTDTIASAVLNDLDLWLDYGADCGTEPCGEHASTSRVDNVEWVVVRNPAPGTYRAKAAASRVYTEAPRAALAWTIIRGDSTPDINISVDEELLEVEDPYEERVLTLSLTADEYVAAGTRLQVDCRGVDGSPCLEWEKVRIAAEREDDVSQRLEAHIGESVEVGELAAGEAWEASVSFGNLAEDGTGSFRLYFKASAWNANAASTSVLTRTTGSETEVPEMPPRGNDGFASATLIRGDEGSERLDLVSAGAEPGEPVFTPGDGRPASSVWYSWTAPSNDKVSFSVTPDAVYDSTDPVRVDVFRGDRVAALESVASAQWGVQFFAESGLVYRIRVSSARRSVPVMLNWTVGSRPANDDFGAAAVLEDASGSIEGTNAGATLEPGEFFGSLAATVWYRWTAPSDGSWQFRSSAGELRVLAFVGERLPDLRLVSGFPAERAEFPARGGDVYWIAVASQDAEAAGLTYELTWGSVDRESGNDDFAGAVEIPGEASSSHRVDIDAEATVEPGEPVESGIRTKWWTWTAPAAGRYAWRLDELTRPTTGSGNRLMVTVFTGEAVDDLQPVATNGEQMSVEFVVSAAAGQRYWIAAGLPAGDQEAFTSWEYQWADATLVWGPAPDNDLAAGAVALEGASGFVSGSNAFATGTRGERSDILGRSTMWWTYEAPASGWVRFSVDGEGGPWALAIHGEDAGGLEVVASGRWQRNGNEVLFEARAGVLYTISLGVRGGGSGGEFTLRWDEADDPGWLRYVGRLADGDVGSRDNPVEIRDPGPLAMHPSGAALYHASGIGLQVFERNETTGGLDHLQSLTDIQNSGTNLIWDPHRERLLAEKCTEWRSFGVAGAGPRLEYLGELTVADNPGTCGKQLLLDAESSNLYRVREDGIDHFAIEEDGSLRFVGADHGSFLRAVLSNDGKHVYAVAPSSVKVFERDAESGELTSTDFDEAISAPGYGTVPLAITHDDAHLFAFDQDGQRPILYSLEDRLNPVRLADLSPSSFWDAPLESRYCKFAHARGGSVAVDVFCPALAFTVSWDANAGQLEVTDWIGERQSDQFNGLPLPAFDELLGFVTSPDDRYMYVSTPQQGIVIIGRGSEPSADDTTVTGLAPTRRLSTSDTSERE